MKIKNKTCSRCGITKPLTRVFFEIKKNKRNGRTRMCPSICMDCKRSYHKQWVGDKRATDESVRLKHVLCQRVRNAIKARRNKAGVEDLVGCSITSLRSHIENQFSDGMSWDNFGDWNIDHIKPLASNDLTDEAVVKCLFHYTNLRPMWHLENKSKGTKTA